MKANPSPSKDRPTSLKASRVPHRKTNQAHARHDAAASRPGAREAPPAGPAAREDQCHSTRCDPPAGCPIALDINLVLDLSEDLNRAMRQLRRKLRACEKCPLDIPCGFRWAFQKRVDAIIHEVNAEWGMP